MHGGGLLELHNVMSMDVWPLFDSTVGSCFGPHTLDVNPGEL